MRKTVILWAIMLIAAIIAGVCARRSYTNVLEQKGIDYFQVALMGEDTKESVYENIKEELPNAEYILRVKATGEKEFLPNSIAQKVVVDNIFKGEGIVPEQVIWVIGTYRFFLSGSRGEEAPDAMQMGFVNFMQEGHEYLIFLSNQCDTIDSKAGQLYELVPFIISPVFDYEERTSTALVSDNVYNSLPYKEVKENEFFAGSQNALEHMQDLKHCMLELFQ